MGGRRPALLLVALIFATPIATRALTGFPRRPPQWLSSGQYLSVSDARSALQFSSALVLWVSLCAHLKARANAIPVGAARAASRFERVAFAYSVGGCAALIASSLVVRVDVLLLPFMFGALVVCLAYVFASSLAPGPPEAVSSYLHPTINVLALLIALSALSNVSSDVAASRVNTVAAVLHGETAVTINVLGVVLMSSCNANAAQRIAYLGGNLVGSLTHLLPPHVLFGAVGVQYALQFVTYALCFGAVSSALHGAAAGRPPAAFERSRV